MMSDLCPGDRDHRAEPETHRLWASPEKLDANTLGLFGVTHHCVTLVFPSMYLSMGEMCSNYRSAGNLEPSLISWWIWYRTGSCSWAELQSLKLNALSGTTSSAGGTQSSTFRVGSEFGSEFFSRRFPRYLKK